MSVLDLYEPWFATERCPRHDEPWIDGRCACGESMGHDDEAYVDTKLIEAAINAENDRARHCGFEGDHRRREANIREGYPLCRACTGTGNRLFSMFQRCARCNGSGRAPKALAIEVTA